MLSNASIFKQRYFAGILQRIVGGVLLLTFGVTACRSFVAARADLSYQKNTPESIRRALDLAPGNAVYLALWAEISEAAGHDPGPYLADLTNLTPLESQYWIRRAFHAEVRGEYARTEEYLMTAARVDHKASPRWALMNFYFRRGRTEDFWRWVTRALEMSRGDVSAIFRLAWEESRDGALIARHIPPRDDLRLSYLEFLVQSDRLDDAGDIPGKVADTASPAAIPLLLVYCDRYASLDPGRALVVWNRLCEKKVIPFKPLNPAIGAIITNGDIETDPSEHGFDWRAQAVDGVTVSQTDGSGGFRIEFSGNQPEDCVLLSQPLPLTPRVKYNVTWESGTAGTEEVAGLLWEVAEIGQPATVASISGEHGFSTGHMAFVAAGNGGELRLRYRRPSGFVRTRGTIAIRGLKAEVIH